VESIHDVVEFLKARKGHQTSRARRLKSTQPDHAAAHRATAGQYDAAISFLINLPNSPAPTDSAEKDLFLLDPLHLDDLPDDFVEELSLSPADTQDAQLMELLRIADRPLTINELMVGSLRKYNVRYKRTALSSRLYRMTQRGLIVSVPKQKGVYALSESNLDDEEK
jgi:hypothetical protein